MASQLWSMSVADVGHSPAVINTNNDATLLKYRYTFTSRYQCLAQTRRWEDLKQHIDTMGETYLRKQMQTLIQSVACVP